MRYIIIVLWVLLAACAAKKSTKLQADACFFGAGQTNAPHRHDNVPFPCYSEFKLKISTNNTFQAEERRTPIEPSEGNIYNYSGEWQSLENEKILLIANDRKFNKLFSIAYDSATAKGIRRIDEQRFILNVLADSVYLGKGIWLYQNRCDSTARLRRK